jgi:anti-sigma B factor antagonist
MTHNRVHTLTALFQRETVPSAGDGFNSVAVLCISGDVDLAGCAQVSPGLHAALHPAPSSLVLDLSAVTYINSTGLALLIDIRQQAERANTDLHLVASQRDVLRPITITGLTGMFRIHATVAVAMAAANTVRRAKSPPAQPHPGLALVATSTNP